MVGKLKPIGLKYVLYDEEDPLGEIQTQMLAPTLGFEFFYSIE